MLKQLRDKLRSLLDERAAKQAEADAIVAGAGAEGRSDLTETETREFRAATARLEEIDDERLGTRNEDGTRNDDGLEARIAELEALDERRRQAEEARAGLGEGEGEDRGERGAGLRVGQEERTYRPDLRHSFFLDAYAQRSGRAGRAIAERLERHAAEMAYESRDDTTAEFGGLVVPQYLVDEFAPLLRNGRAFLNSVRRLPLPEEGMAFVVPRAQTGSSTAAQATENAAVSETDVDFDNDLTIQVRTFAGQQDVSRQSLERGSPGIDRLLYADLVEDYAETVDTSAISDDGTSGTHVGLLNVTGETTITYTDATPTVAELWPKLSGAVAGVAAARKRGPRMWMMHSRRWGFLTSALDTTNRPLISTDPGEALALMGTAMMEQFGEGQIVGTLQGLPVLVDNNIPVNLGAGTNEDRIFALRNDDFILWEEGDGMPRELRFEETAGGNLTVKLVVYGYSAFTGDRRPEGLAVIAGTGLVTPTF